MAVPFTKMHGLGNDFVVIDGFQAQVTLSSELVRAIADRKRGIGCDQLLYIQPSTTGDVDYCIYNSDGTEASQCGNGARCVAKYVNDKGYCSGPNIRLVLKSCVIVAEIRENGLVTVDMGIPNTHPEAVPFITESPAKTYELAGPNGDKLTAVVLSMGNPHMVLQCHHILTTDIVPIGRFFNEHSRFPMGVNVGFMQVISPEQVHLRVFERGAGETEACGSGACAAFAAGRMLGLVDRAVKVKLTGGDLEIEQKDRAIHMTGPAVSVFDGQYY